MERETARNPITRWVVHPVTTVLCLAVIAASFLRLPEWTPLADSTAAKLRMRLAGRVVPQVRFGSTTYGVLPREPEGFAVVDMAEGGWSWLTSAHGEPSLFEVVVQQRRAGLWALEREQRRVQVFRVLPVEGDLNTPDRLFLISHLAEQGLLTRGEARQLQHVEEASTLRPLWPGILHTAFIVLIAVVAVRSLAWWLPTARQERKRGKARALGRCGRCGYEVGSGAGTCPECGEHYTAALDVR